MQDRQIRSKSRKVSLLLSSLAIIGAALISSCSGSTGPAVAQTFHLLTIDGTSLPAAIRNADGRIITIGVGRLQGTDLGPSCGMSLQLGNGPITTVEVPSCKLEAGKDFTFTTTLSDPRFPSGPHVYRFAQP